MILLELDRRISRLEMQIEALKIQLRKIYDNRDIKTTVMPKEYYRLLKEKQRLEAELRPLWNEQSRLRREIRKNDNSVQLESYRRYVMRNKSDAKEYMNSMRNAIGDKLVNPDSVYYGENGHRRFARECGYALNDFDKEGQNEILHGSYSCIYVIGCNLKPILNAKEWIQILRSQIK